ncbi:MAG: 3-keto-disaccharide hydrolase [Thermoguttaceae bacterium]
MRKLSFVLIFGFVFVVCASAYSEDYVSGIDWKEPPVITAGDKPGDPPSDAIILFDGKDLSAWNKQEWIVSDGCMTVKPGSGEIQTKEKFGSVQLHIEFATPTKVEGSSQGRGNSGVFFGPYEVQVLDSYDNKTYFDGQCASIYKQRAPLVNVCKKPGEWQMYDIIFRRPDLKIADGKVVEVLRPGYLTVFQNGVLVIDNHEIEGTTFWHRAPEYEAHDAKLPIRLQDHGNETKFRNIWVRPIPDDPTTKPPKTREPYFRK